MMSHTGSTMIIFGGCQISPKSWFIKNMVNIAVSQHPSPGSPVACLFTSPKNKLVELLEWVHYYPCFWMVGINIDPYPYPPKLLIPLPSYDELCQRILSALVWPTFSYVVWISHGLPEWAWNACKYKLTRVFIGIWYQHTHICMHIIYVIVFIRYVTMCDICYVLDRQTIWRVSTTAKQSITWKITHRGTVMVKPPTEQWSLRVYNMTSSQGWVSYIW